MSLADELGQPVWFIALDDDADWLERLHEMFLGSGDLRCAGTTSRVDDVARLVRDNGAEVILVDHGLGGRSGLAVAGEFARRLPSVRVYLMTESPTRQLWEEARRHALRGVVRKPFQAADLTARLRDDLELDARVVADLETRPARGQRAVPPAAVEGPRTIAVFAFKGGVGKSLLATSLALAAGSPAARRRRSVVLVDGEEGVGSVGVLLGVVARPTLLDWADWSGERQVDPAIAATRLAETRYGIRCLFAPGEMDRSVDRALMETVLATLPRMTALTVVDCAPAVTAAVLGALEAATTVALVVEPTLDCLEKTRKGLQALSAAGVGTGKFRLVVNVPRPGGGDYTPAEVREALGLQVLGTLPFDPAAKRAANRRRPLALESPRGPFVSGLCRCFAGLLPGIGEGPGLGSLGWRRWPQGVG